MHPQSSKRTLLISNDQIPKASDSFLLDTIQSLDIQKSVNPWILPRLRIFEWHITNHASQSVSLLVGMANSRQLSEDVASLSALIITFPEDGLPLMRSSGGVYDILQLHSLSLIVPTVIISKANRLSFDSMYVS